MINYVKQAVKRDIINVFDTSDRQINLTFNKFNSSMRKLLDRYTAVRLVD